MGIVPCKVDVHNESVTLVAMVPHPCVPSVTRMINSACTDPFITEREMSDMLQHDGSNLLADEDVGLWNMATIAEVLADARPHRVCSDSSYTSGECLKLGKHAEDVVDVMSHHVCRNYKRGAAHEPVPAGVCLSSTLTWVPAAEHHDHNGVETHVRHLQDLEQQQMASKQGATWKKRQKRSSWWIALILCCT